jgi:dolichol kinase
MSQRDGVSFSLEAFMLDVQAVVNRLGLDRFALLGFLHSGLIAIPLLFYSQKLVVGIIAFFFVLYPIIEMGLAKGFHIPLLSHLTKNSKRPHEHRSGFAWPAYFIAIGYLFSIIFFRREVACLAILHVSLGDSIAAIVGQQWGKSKLPFNHDKSWLGSGAYLVATFLAGLFFLPWLPSLILAVTGALIESLPFKNFDNLLIPVVISLLANVFF